MTVRVLLADDQALLRATFTLLVDSAPDMEVVGEASTGAEAVAGAHAHLPDVILMDIRMPGLDGIEATARITAQQGLSAVKVLVLTTFETDDLVVAALRAGASGYLGKGVDPGTLLRAIRTVASGESLLSPTATTALIARFLEQRATGAPGGAGRAPTGPAARAALASLTPRERELAALVALGLSNDDIAEQLHISATTAKTHVNRAMTKVGARDRAQLVVFAYENGLTNR